MATSVLNTICATHITNVFTVKYDRGVERNMVLRAWYGMSLAIDGEIVYHHNGKDIVSDPGHLVILPMGGTYHFECTKPGRFTLLNFLCTDSFHHSDFLRIPIKNPDVFIKHHKLLEQMYSLNNPDNFARLMSVFYKMLSMASGDVGDEVFGKGDMPTVLRPAIKYLEENISSPELTNSVIAQNGGISEVYFTKLFRQNLGISPKQYIQQVRINKAKEMLVSENLSVSEVSDACGYASLYHFCRAFRQKTGYTPGEYRNEFKNMGI